MKPHRAALGLTKALAALAVLASIGTGGLAPGLLAAEEVDAKGMYLQQTKSGLKFSVLLNRDCRETQVSSGHRFQSGDRMRFQFQLNNPAFVYVVHREISGDPASKAVSRYAGPKGILFVRSSQASGNEPRRATRQSEGTTAPREAVSPPAAATGALPRRTPYKLLFPSEGAGRSNKLEAGVIHTVPWSDGRFTMDESPGIEKLYLVASPARLEGLEAMFDPKTGELNERADNGAVTARLVAYSDNAKVSIGKVITVQSYGAGVDSAQAFMTEVDLAHYPAAVNAR